MILLDKQKLNKLAQFGLSFDGERRQIPSDFICEIPAALKRTEIGPKVKIGAFSYMVSGHLFATTIGRYCSIGEEVQIGRQNHPIDWLSTSPFFYLPSQDILPTSKKINRFLRNQYYEHGANPTSIKHTTIGHDVWIGHGAIINAGVKIGNGAIIAAGSVVTKDVPKYTIVGGNPAKHIRYRIPEELIERIEDTQWWNYSPKQLEKYHIHDLELFLDQFSTENHEILNNSMIFLKDFKF